MQIKYYSSFHIDWVTGFLYKLEHAHDLEHVRVVEGLRLRSIADFKGFKGFLSSSLIGLKLRIHIQLSTFSGSAQKVRFINVPLYSENKMYPQEIL